MKTFLGKWIALFVGVVFLLPATALGISIPVPPSLSVGDTYQLVFVTSIVTDALSSNIDYYNEFVQSAADAAGLGAITWKAIGSTHSVDAKDNALVSAPVYRLDGVQVAAGFNDFWDESLLAPIDVAETLEEVAVDVWTGSSPDGTPSGWSAGYGMGYYGDPAPYWIDYGKSNMSDAGWIDYSWDSPGYIWVWWGHKYIQPPYHYKSMYALSEQLTVGVVPEPSTLVLFGIGMLGVLGYGLSRNRRKKSSV